MEQLRSATNLPIESTDSECQGGDGSEKRAVDKHNPEISNAPCSSGRRRVREMMWADMGEDMEMHLKLKTSFLPFWFVRENEFTIFGDCC